MGIGERFEWMLLGIIIGFVLGFFVARLRAIEEKVDIVKDNTDKGQGGFMRQPMIANVLYLLVLTIVVWGAVSAQRASNEVAKTTECNREYLSDTILALNERTTYSQEQSMLNVKLQRAQAILINILQEEPPPTDDRLDWAFEEYSEALSNYLEVSSLTREKTQEYSYPTDEDFSSCIAED